MIRIQAFFDGIWWFSLAPQPEGERETSAPFSIVQIKFFEVKSKRWEQWTTNSFWQHQNLSKTFPPKISQSVPRNLINTWLYYRFVLSESSYHCIGKTSSNYVNCRNEMWKVRSRSVCRHSLSISLRLLDCILAILQTKALMCRGGSCSVVYPLITSDI